MCYAWILLMGHGQLLKLLVKLVQWQWWLFGNIHEIYAYKTLLEIKNCIFSFSNNLKIIILFHNFHYINVSSFFNENNTYSDYPFWPALLRTWWPQKIYGPHRDLKWSYIQNIQTYKDTSSVSIILPYASLIEWASFCLTNLKG